MLINTYCNAVLLPHILQKSMYFMQFSKKRPYRIKANNLDAFPSLIYRQRIFCFRHKQRLQLIISRKHASLTFDFFSLVIFVIAKENQVKVKILPLNTKHIFKIPSCISRLSITFWFTTHSHNIYLLDIVNVTLMSLLFKEISKQLSKTATKCFIINRVLVK